MREYMFSVIIPVHNEGEGMKKCVNSLIRQDYRDYEIILVDDGSRDCSVQICDMYARRYEFISVIHKENGGCVDARRVGIEAAKGTYIVFADADDYVEKDYMEHLHQAVRHPADLYMLNAWNLSLSLKKKWIHDKNIKEGYIDNLQATEEILGRVAGYHVWNKIYVADVIKKNNIRFTKKIVYGEDLYINLRYLRHVGKVWVQNTASYVYIYESPTSVCVNGASLKRFDELEVVYLEAERYIREMNASVTIYNKFLSFYLGAVVRLIATLLQDNVKEEEIDACMENNRLVHAISEFKPKGIKYKVYAYLVKNRKLIWCKKIRSLAECYKKIKGVHHGWQ